MDKVLDVHGLSLDKAKSVINKAINTAYIMHRSVVVVNHGFNLGNKIKTWCLKEGSKICHVKKVTSGENEGLTNFFIDIKIY